MAIDLIMALGGLAGLLIAGDLLVRGAVGLALRLGIPALVVSMTVVAFGTSAPELLISLQSVLEGAPGLAIGNVVGSNTANVLLVLGVPALIAGLNTSCVDTSRSYLIMLAISVIFIAICFLGPLGVPHALILLVILILFLADSYRQAKEDGGSDNPEDLEVEVPKQVWPFLILGLIGLPLSAHFLVEGSVNIARTIGVSEPVIGLTLIAIGTSLPELATTVSAAIRRNAEVAIGGVIGSNVFNLLAIIGISAFFGTIPVPEEFLRFDLWVMVGASVVIAPIVMKRLDMGRLVGIGLVSLYAIYIYVVLAGQI